MYGWLWHHLPGPLVLRLLQLTVLLAGVLALLFFVVFPQVESLLPYNDVTVKPGPQATSSP